MKIKVKEGVTNDDICDLILGGTVKNNVRIFGRSKVINMLNAIKTWCEFDEQEEMIHTPMNDFIADMDRIWDVFEEV